MAESVDFERTKYFCHHCSREVSPLHTVELSCPSCSSGFIEEVSRDLYQAEEDSEFGQYDGMDEWINGLDDAFRIQSILSQALQNVGLEDSDLREREEDQQEADSPRLPGIQEILMGLQDQDESVLRLRYLGDYILGEDIDALTTQLLNEAEISGPPPLPKEQIKLLPVVTITKEEVEKGMQCTVCMDDFCVREKAKLLPCDHFYHEKCITPWLERHATCPNCRKIVDVQSRSRRSRSCPRSSIHSDADSRHYSESSSSSTSSSLSDFFSTSINPFRFLH